MIEITRSPRLLSLASMFIVTQIERYHHRILEMSVPDLTGKIRNN